MVFIYLLLLVCIIIGPVGAVVRALRFANKPANYVYPENSRQVGMSVVHDIIVLVIVPGTYLGSVGLNMSYDASPYELIFLMSLIVVVVCSYFTGVLRRSLLAPAVEVGGLLMMGIGIVINLYLATENSFGEVSLIFGGIGHLPVILLCILMIYRRHRLFQLAVKQEKAVPLAYNDILDYIPDRSGEKEYAASRDGWQGILWLEGWQKLLLAIGVSGGILAILVGGLAFFT